MAELKARVRRDLTDAMKSRDELRASTLRLALTAIRNAEVAGKEQRELSDGEVTDVLGSEAKKRREAAQAFADAGRPELATKETAEAAILMDYLPEQLDADAIQVLVTETVEELGVAGEGMKAMGRVMGALQPKVKGRAEGGVVAAEVKRQLGA
ncbi:MAG TPA: GatB/YqeY domain-containing protein [Nocardioidaceae bacterium]|nr:GatB/YqeY domain-containing protein [Nocardioidaceae bacterium]